VLHDWILIAWPGYGDAYMIAGVVTGDRKRRFADGSGIHTSMILTPIDQIGEGLIVPNTKYAVSAWRKTAAQLSRLRPEAAVLAEKAPAVLRPRRDIVLRPERLVILPSPAHRTGGVLCWL
jgi:hypothetical protein